MAPNNQEPVDFDKYKSDKTEEERAKEFYKTVTPEGLFNYYQSLNRQQRRVIDKQAAKMKRANRKIDFKRMQRELKLQREQETASKFTNDEKAD